MITVGVLIAGACFSAALFVLVMAWRRRNSIYRYDVTRDQHYDFSAARSTRVTGQLLNGRLEIPAIEQGTGVVLLELRIRSTLLGGWFEPFIELESTRGRCRQPFERGGSGLRYVGLAAPAFAGERSIRLKGHHLKIDDQAVVIHYVTSELELDRQRILVLGTHPDDAEIAAFGVYADRNAYVVTLTAGEAGEVGAFEKFGGAMAYREKGRHRAWNSVAVPMLGGLSIDRTVNLGYFDGTLEAMREYPDNPVRSLNTDAEFLDVFGQSQDTELTLSRHNRAATWTNLLADLEHLVKTIRPDIIVTPYPKLDAHPDHKMSTVALMQALRNLNWQHGSLLLYTNHLCSSDRYPFGNAGDLVSLPPGVDGIFFESIISNPLDAEKQARKDMALDAMIDLRPVVRIDSLSSVAAAFKKVVKSMMTDRHTSYFRQAVRANELFFEVRVASLYKPGVTERILG